MFVRILGKTVIARHNDMTVTFPAKGKGPSDKRQMVEYRMKGTFRMKRKGKWENNHAEFKR
jgi:hypothetical protein